MTPYRASSPVADVSDVIPWWQRVWFRFNSDGAAQRWQWARRAIGGRWSKLLADCGRVTVWKQANDCPARGRGDLGCDKHKCYCEPINAGMCHVRKCYCEVYP